MMKLNTVIGIALVILIGLIMALVVMSRGESAEKQLDVCTRPLSDLEYLEHMIPHHQVAVDVSEAYQKTSTDPVMQALMRKLVWTQKREIAMMHELKLTAGREQGMSASNGMEMGYRPVTVGDYVPPNTPGLTHTHCDPHFFDPEAHMAHIEHMGASDRAYIEHMIPHHQVAVDMSKVLLRHTNNDYMIYMAHRIIRSQQEEIALLQSMLDKNSMIVNSHYIQ